MTPKQNKFTITCKPITIDKDVPLPRPRSQSTQWPFAGMVAGDSFLIPENKTYNQAACAMRDFKKIHGELCKQLDNDIINESLHADVIIQKLFQKVLQPYEVLKMQLKFYLTHH